MVKLFDLGYQSKKQVIISTVNIVYNKDQSGAVDDYINVVIYKCE